MTSLNTSNFENNILNTQNSDENIRKLASQRELYSKAKRIYSLQIALATIGVVALSLASFKFEIQWIIATYGVCVTLFDLTYLNEKIKKVKSEAAIIQEMFDCDVLGIEWNSLIQMIEPNKIYRNSEKYFKKNKSFGSLRDWYSSKIEGINPIHAKLICQYTNCSYDKSLRNKFYNCTCALYSLVAFSIFAMACAKGITIRNLFESVLLPLLPLIVLSINKSKENTSSVKTSEQIITKTNDPSSIKNINDDDANHLSRDLQNIILRNRIESPLVFDWFYNLNRDDLEQEMDYSVQNLVDLYHQNTIE